jgi:2-dehydro-3-deoxy-phosphogluconate aldolase
MSMQKPTIKLNVLAKNVENAKQIVELTNGNVYIGVMVKNFKSVEAAVTTVKEYQSAQIPVSVGLGAGDPSMWKMVVDVAMQTKPVHVNQVFPAAGYTLGSLRALGSDHTILNALITPSGIPGKVFITTGPQSGKYKEPISCDAAAAMLAELNVLSVKFYPISGTERLDEVAEMVKAAVRHQIKIFEPTGGIDIHTIQKIVEVCVENGAETVIPHIYTSIIDAQTGLTRLEDVQALMRSIS